MKYKTEWKGRVRLALNRELFLDGVPIGKVLSRHVDGAKSPGGMVTNTAFEAWPTSGGACVSFESMEFAIEYLIKRTGRMANVSGSEK